MRRAQKAAPKTARLGVYSTWMYRYSVLIRFKKPVVYELVRITEAVMTILLGAWHDPIYLSLRHSALPPITYKWGLNNASPLDNAITKLRGLSCISST